MFILYLVKNQKKLKNLLMNSINSVITEFYFCFVKLNNKLFV